MSDPQLQLPAIIPGRLGQFDRRRRFSVVVRGVAESALAFCLGLFVVMLLEWAFHPGVSARWALSGTNYLCAGAVLFYRLILPLAQARGLRRIAWDFETAARGRYQERIVSAVEMAQVAPDRDPGVSLWMMERTIAIAAEEIGAADPALLVDLRPAIRASKRMAPVLFLLALACLSPGFRPRAWLAVNPRAATLSLSRFQFTVAPGNCRIQQGNSLAIKAAGQKLPEQAHVSIRWDDGFRESVLMSRADTNEFTLALAAVSQGFRYSVQAGDAESGVFTVKVEAAPRISRMQLEIEPPAYAHWPRRVVEGGSADFLAGSRVRLLVQTAGEPVADAEWISDAPEVRKMARAPDGLRLELAPANPVSYQVRLMGVNKLRAKAPQQWTLRPIPDEPPALRLVAIGTDAGMVQPDEVLPLKAIATDDVGLKRLDLVALSQDAQADLRSLYAPAQPDARELKVPINYNLAELSLLTGDEVQFQLIGVDLFGQTNRSEPLSFTVGSPDKALEAQLAARLKELVAAMTAQSEYLQQTRASWLSIARNYRDQDPFTQRPALAVLQTRLDEFGAAMNDIGRQLVAESETNSLAEARFLYRLGTTISAAGAQQREVLLASCGRVVESAGTNVYEAFNLGRELFSHALLDVEQYQTALAVLEGALETDVLATRCVSAQARYKRGLPVLRGENVIAPLGQTASGLRATFLAGLTLDGEVLEEKIDHPRFDNYAPAGRREQWSARYEGELNIPEAGDWTLACVADDGVRLVVDGKSVLPANAWAPHPATQYQADLALSAGWHPVRLEFFQGSSESKLQFLAGKKGQPLLEVPAPWLRPPAVPNPKPELATNAVLAAITKAALKDRTRSSLSAPAAVPPTLAPMTNSVHNENFARLVRQGFPAGEQLATNLLNFVSWQIEDSKKAEAQADELTSLARESQRILREELEKYRWRYEGAAALKEIQNAIEEMRELSHELRQLPWHHASPLTETEAAKVELVKIWQQELARATARASHQFFEIARQKDGTLAGRITALNATTKIDQELQPAVATLATTLRVNRPKDTMAEAIEQRLSQISNRYRELNDMQEKINREQVAAEARQAFPAARAFARAQRAEAAAGLDEKHASMVGAVAPVLKAQRVAGEYAEARKLVGLAGRSAAEAKGKETAQMLRELANRTDNNPPGLAQSIPPPMREQVRALDQHNTTPVESANTLAKPRLAMALEGARLAHQGDRRTAAAYGLLGDDLGGLLEAPNKLDSPALQPLADRAAALAGEKGDEARQAEIRAANERLKRLAAERPQNPEALAGRLEAVSGLARDAAGQAPMRQPLRSELEELGRLAPPVPDWTESTDPDEIASSAAHESADTVQAAPNQWESYNDASQILAEAARQIRLDSAASDLAALNPYPLPPGPSEDPAAPSMSSGGKKGSREGLAGQAAAQPAPRGIDQAEWARLNERLRQAIRSSGIENFSEEHQAAIRAYFERLSAGSLPAKP